MLGRLFLIALLLAGGCSSRDEELAAAKGARSVVAEWGAVERLDGAHRLPDAYAGMMRDKAREALASDRKSIKDGEAARTADSVAAAAPSASGLAAAGAHLQQAVDRLEAR